MAEELAINPGTLGNWVKKYRQDNPEPEKKMTPADHGRLAELEEQNRQLKMENEFLKKAALDSKGECNAVAEPRVAMLDETGLVEEGWGEGSPDPFIHIVGEYRWVDGDEDCDLTQPDHYYLYSMDLGDDALIYTLDTEFVDYGEAPATVPEPEAEDPGLFDD